MGTHKKYTSHRALRQHSRHLCHSLRTAHHLPAHPDVFIFRSETTRYGGCCCECFRYHSANLGLRGLVNLLLLREYPHTGVFRFLCPCLCPCATMPNVWLLLLPMAIFGVAQGLNLPSAFSLLTASAPQENRGAFMSMNSTVLRLGQSLGPPLMAAAALPLGLSGAYFAAAALAAAMLFVALAV